MLFSQIEKKKFVSVEDVSEVYFKINTQSYVKLSYYSDTYVKIFLEKLKSAVVPVYFGHFKNQ